MFNLGGKNKYRIEVTNTENDFCISIYTNERGEYFRLINDAFTRTIKKPDTSVPIAEYNAGSVKITADAYSVYDVLNNLKLLRVSEYDLPVQNLSEKEKQELLYLVKACADLMEYNSKDYDIHTVMRHMLYTYKNFTLLSNIPPQHSQSGSIQLCGSDFIDDVLYKAFRLTPEKPAVNMLTELGYCYNNGFYYSAGGYNTYFATDVKEILSAYTLPDDSILLIFKNEYTEGDSSAVQEISSAVAAKDKNGFYLLSLNMGGELPDIHGTVHHDTETDTEPNNVKAYYPLFIAIIGLALIGIIIYWFLMR